MYELLSRFKEATSSRSVLNGSLEKNKEYPAAAHAEFSIPAGSGVGGGEAHPEAIYNLGLILKIML
jgi:hypothetical protein